MTADPLSVGNDRNVVGCVSVAPLQRTPQPLLATSIRRRHEIFAGRHRRRVDGYAAQARITAEFAAEYDPEPEPGGDGLFDCLAAAWRGCARISH